MITDSYFNETDDITCMHEYEVMPEYIKIGLPDTCFPVIHRIIKTLSENPDFKSIAMAGSLFQWDIDEDYNGKPRHGEITFLNGRDVYAFFSFTNDYSGAEFEVDCTKLIDEVIKSENYSIITP